MKKIPTILIVSLLIATLCLPLAASAEKKKEHLEFTRERKVYTPALGSQTIVYTNTPTLKEYFRTYSPHGMAFQSIWVVANVMDDTGKKYNLLRQYKTEDTTMTMASREIPGLDARAEPLFEPGAMLHGRIFHEMDEENNVILVKPFLPNSTAYRVLIRPQHIEWQDADGRIDLTFDALGPALEYYCPGHLEDALYRSEPHYVTGTVNGKKVSGFGVIDAAWGSVGVGFLQGKIYQVLEENWIVWLNIYEDGSKECGIFINGLDRFEAFYYNKNGQAQVTRRNKMVPEFTEDGFIRGAEITMDDLTFEFVSESRIMQMQSFVTWASGRIINKKEKRKPVRSFAWYEFFPKGN
jgi:hypothetical protein